MNWNFQYYTPANQISGNPEQDPLHANTHTQVWSAARESATRRATPKQPQMLDLYQL